MTERDRDLEQALSELPVPDHAPGFWGRLDDQLARQAPTETGTTTGGHGEADEARAVPDDQSATVVAFDRPSRRGSARVSWLALVAAVVVAVVSGVAVLRSLEEQEAVVTVAGETTDDGADPPVGGSANEEGAPEGTDGDGEDQAGPTVDRTVDRTVDPTRIEAVEPLGPGLVVGALAAADGSTTVLVRDRLPSDEAGCEGAPLEGLLVLHGDGTTSPVLAADGSFVVNGADVHPAPVGDLVAVSSMCEGFLTQLLVGRVGPDGVPTDLEVVAGYPTGSDAPFPGAPPVGHLSDLSWTADGTRLLVTTADGVDGSRTLWSYSPAGGSWEQRSDAPIGVVAAVERSDGSLVALTEDALVVGSDVRPRRGATNLALAPDGRTVAVSGPEGLLVLDGVGDRDQWLDVGSVSDAQFLPDGAALVFSRFVADQEPSSRLMSVVLDADGSPTGSPVELGSSAWGWFRLSPDGEGVLVTVDGSEDHTGFADPAVQRWEFAS